MSLRYFAEAWNRFFFTPQSPVPICLFRILYGSMVVATVLLFQHDWLSWYGVHGWVRLATMRQLEPGMRLNLFTVLPQNDRWINALFWVFLGSAVLLTLGFLTRLNMVFVFLCLTSIDQRNLYILHGGDTFLRVAGFFLIFAPAGAALSLDRLLRVRRGKEGGHIMPRSPWAQRIIQIELSLVYLMSFWWKLLGDPWVNGTALFYVVRVNELQRFPVPHWIAQPILLRLGTWLTLALEFSLGVFIWFKRLRYPLLLLGLLFHLSIEYALNIPMFQWDILSAYVLFVDADDVSRFAKWIRGRRQRYEASVE